MPYGLRVQRALVVRALCSYMCLAQHINTAEEIRAVCTDICRSKKLDSSSRVLPFAKTWYKFLQYIDLDPQRIGTREYQRYEFSLLRKFSKQQSLRSGNYSDVDRFYRPFADNKVDLLDGTPINASLISFEDAYFNQDNNDYHHFIASRAPAKNHISSFWQMILENSIDQIVMLTELIEGPKKLCHVYWPQIINQKLILENGIEITLLQERTVSPELKERLDIRKFNVRHSGSDRIVTHYWYRNWADNTAPKQPETLKTLIKLVKGDKVRLQSKSPVLTHCAAGIGRTGLFIALYHLIQRAYYNDHKVALVELVAYLRWQRPNMVATQKQYAFCSGFKGILGQ